MKRLFLLFSLTFSIFMIAAGAPTLLYEVYQRLWQFSPATLTVVFSVYAFTVLSALLVFGSMSDHVGRRPVLLLSLSIEAVSMVFFALASGVVWLFAVRKLQGIATGIGASVLVTSLLDTQPKDRPGLAPVVNTVVPVFGLGVGAIVTSLLVAYIAYPIRLVYWILLASLLSVGLLIATSRETGVTAPGWMKSLKPSIAVSQEAKLSFVHMGSGLGAGWALAGLYLALGPSVVSSMLQTGSKIDGGLLILTFTGISALTSALLRSRTNDHLILIGTVVSAVGLSITAFSVMTLDLYLFFVATAVCGIGIGSSFTGSFKGIMSNASKTDRAGLAAAVYILSYLAFGVPVIIAGIATTIARLSGAVLVYDIAATFFMLLTFAMTFARNRQIVLVAETRKKGPTSDNPPDGPL